MTKRLLFPLVVVIALAILIPSLQPGIGWYNTGEFAVAALTLDVPHAPGYPLFTRMANLMLRVPIVAEPAWKVNLVSALVAALGAGLFALWLRAGGLSPMLAGAAALWMVSFTTFWEMATSAEVYTTEILLLAGFLFVTWRVRTTGFGLADWLLIGLLTGLGLGHRPTFLPLAGGILLLTWGIPSRAVEPGVPHAENRPDHPANWGTALTGLVAGFALGMIPTFDLFLRLQNPGLVLTDPLLGQGFDGFWRIFTAAAYRKGLGVFSVPELLARGRAWLEMMAADGGLPALLLPVLAWLGRPLAWHPQIFVLTWILLANTGFVLNYNAFEAQTMLLPSMLALTGLAAHGLHARRGKGRRLLAWSLAIVAAVSFLVSSHRLEPRQRDAEDWARKLVQRVPIGATLLVSNDVEFRPLWYLRLVHRFRPDLSFRLIDRIEEKDLDEIEKDVKGRGAFGTLVFPEDLRQWLSTRFRLEPLGYVTAIRRPLPAPEPGPATSWSRPMKWEGASGTICAAVLRDRRPDTEDPRESRKAGEVREVQEVQDVRDARDAGNLREVREVRGTRKSGERPAAADFQAAPGETVDWTWRAEGLGPAFHDLLAALFLVDADGRVWERHGVSLGYDLHSLADGLPPALFREVQRTGACLGRRSLVIPDGLPAGRYRLNFLVGRVSNSRWKHLLIDRIEGLNLLNEDGATEVFRLKYGLGAPPFLRTTDWNGLLASLGQNGRLPEWVTLAMVDVP